jgi:two-component system, OmpR family, KDP operon response regulator KdpE
MAYEPSILIVEDDASVRKYFEKVLSEDGYCITSVATGRHGLLVARDTAFDLVIVDMSLPDLDGPHVIREIIADFPDIKAIATSGAMEEQMRSLARVAGAVSVFQKPITPRNLRNAVYVALDPSYSWRGTA